MMEIRQFWKRIIIELSLPEPKAGLKVRFTLLTLSKLFLFNITDWLWSAESSLLLFAGFFFFSGLVFCGGSIVEIGYYPIKWLDFAAFVITRAFWHSWSAARVALHSNNNNKPTDGPVWKTWQIYLFRQMSKKINEI